MKIYTSYFYKVRFFKPNIIPISTAMWDPKWFHQNKGQDYQFFDKNGVINGLRADVFAPGPVASQLCRGACNPRDPENCHFLRAYEHQLNQLDFNDIMQRIEKLCENVRSVAKFADEPVAVLLVHEVTDNPCSERSVIQKWFKSHGVEVTEYEI